MMNRQTFLVEPWQVREPEFDLDTIAQTESVFALSNGHIGFRGNLDEGEPHGLPGTYLNSVYENRPLPYAEAGYGYPQTGETVINVPNGKLIRLLVDDEPFDVRYGELNSHERTLDLRAGVLRRSAEWTSPAGGTVRVRSTRLVSLSQRAVAAIEYEVEAVQGRTRLVVQSELVANEALPAQSHDPRAAAALEAPLIAEEHWCRESATELVHRTAQSNLRVAAAMDHEVTGPEGTRTEVECHDDDARTTVTTVLEPGQTLRVVKYLAYGWSGTRSRSALRDQVSAALSGARYTGWQGLLDEQKSYLDEYWERADVELVGDPVVQQAVRFALFHVLQGGARAERRPIPAKGLTGPGYDGHVFWDTETFVLPLLTLCVPGAAADALRWRHSALPAARERARQFGLAGAAFPWRTISGSECSGYWPAGAAAFHINADIAYAVVRYLDVTGDEDFEAEVGLELLVETARLYRSLGHHDRQGRFRIDGVTGPDEYSAIADNNVYTNLMAQQNLREAAAAVERHPRRAAALGVDEEEAASWRDAATAMLIPFDHDIGVHPQAEGFTHHARWDFSTTHSDQYPLLLHYPYFELYRKQVVKQADLVLAMHLRGDAFTPEQKARNFTYYERLTVRDSSLSASTQAIIAAEVGHLDLAYDYAGEAALMDLHDLEHNTADGVHLASLAGGWGALVAGFGGLRFPGRSLSFAPRLPVSRLSRLTFRLTYRGSNLRVTVEADSASYVVTSGPPLTLTHHGRTLTVRRDAPVALPIPPFEIGDPPAQPSGRAPERRIDGAERADR